ncbi:carbohydrate porin [Acinetobacter sp. S40]|uniref:carbohydrate porin n=1 Tax=unclassified Acinetobacter TaxID=196816 RepID=UPI00190CFF63|nr:MULTISPECIES: carbohydrate porin [unclassified Acinetobacter]MBJ9984834.1 carbohydrate porin [Acinetobacter sp. S40]MBK0063175.1 carbohydrate porin [Acinetobacter sp. S55]MBK0066407.1 carbohydrate porin [Acinetobacter sp. S54]
MISGISTLESYLARQWIIIGILCLSTHTFANDVLSSDRQYLLGDWNGKRTELSDKGIEFNVAFINEAATNLHGGYNDDSALRSANQWTFGSSFNLEKLWGWENTVAKLAISKRDGQGLSEDRIADPRAKQFSNVQEINGRGQVWRLSQMYLQTSSLDKHLVFKIGRMNMGEDFNSAQCEFQNLTLCGAQVGKTVGNVWYNWPITVWATNIKYSFSPAWTLGIGIYESNAENTKESKGFNLSTDGSKGVVIPVELIWKTKFNELAGTYRFGGFYSTADAKDVLTDKNGQLQTIAANREIHDGKYNLWLVAQQQLTHHAGDDQRGLTAYLSLNMNDQATTQLRGSQQIAFIYKGAFDSRPKDSIGLGIARSQMNKRFRERQNALNEQKQIFNYDDPQFTPLQYNETNVELNYTLNWSPSIMIRPNVQFVHQPGGVKQVDDAWVLGLTTRFTF